jgi:electron transport complex protein RnfB
MFIAIFSLSALGLVLGLLLGTAARFLKVEGNALAGEIEALLPGSQCGQCGYPGCGPAAEALASGAVPVTVCPPGGRALAEVLAAKLGVSADLSGVEDQAPMLAFINEALCVGCTRCFKRCPTDAILGASRQIHAVLTEACTGCGKCVDICPTECVEMHEVRPTLQTWYWPRPVQVGA